MCPVTDSFSRPTYPLTRAFTVSTFPVFILKERHPLYYETVFFPSFVLDKQNYYLSFYIR